jgi:hypothetical protein
MQNYFNSALITDLKKRVFKAVADFESFGLAYVLNSDFESIMLICNVTVLLGKQDFCPRNREADCSVFAFGISASEQLEVMNMKNENEMQEEFRRIEVWTYRAMMERMRCL